MFEKLAENENLKLESTNKLLLGHCNYKIKCLGKFTGKLTANNKSLDKEFYIVKV